MKAKSNAEAKTLEERAVSFDFENWMKRQPASQAISILREGFDASNGQAGLHIYSMRISFDSVDLVRENRGEDRFFCGKQRRLLKGLDPKTPLIYISKSKYATFRGTPQRDMRSRTLFAELIPVTEDEKQSVADLMSQGRLVNFQKHQTYGYAYMGSPEKVRQFKNNNYLYAHVVGSSVMDPVIAGFEEKNGFLAVVKHQVGLNLRDRPDSWDYTLGLELSKGVHYVERRLDSWDIFEDRKKRGVKTVMKKSVVQPGHFLFVYKGKDGKYAFVHYGLFDMFGKLSGLSKGMIDQTLADLEQENHGMECIRVYDGMASTVSSQRKEHWQKEFNGKPAGYVLAKLDRELGAVYDAKKAHIVSLIPHTTDLMYLPHENETLPSAKFHELLQQNAGL